MDRRVGRRQRPGRRCAPPSAPAAGALGDRARRRRADGPRIAQRHRLDPARHRPARATPGGARQLDRRPRLEQAAHRGEAAELLDPGQGRGGQLRAGRDPVRGPPGAPRQGLAHRGPGRRPRDGPGGALDPHRGADPGQGRRRHRDPQLGQRGRRLQAARRREPDARIDEPADVRARPRRVGQGLRRRPRQDAAPARRRRDRLGQERVRQRAHHEPADARPPGRGPDDPGRPQAGRARAVQRPAAPAPARDRRARRGEGRAELGGPRDGGSLQAARRPQRPQHRRLQRAAGGERGRAPGGRRRRRRRQAPCRRTATATRSGCPTSS